MSKPILEKLPFDILVEIFAQFDNFHDVQTLTTASPVCFRFLNTYETPALTTIAKNLISKDAWDAAIQVLSYQRHSNNPTIGSSAEGDNEDECKPVHENPFCLRKSDIRQLLANQRYFESCCEDLPLLYYLNYHQFIDLPEADHAGFNFGIIPTLKFGDLLPMKLFYQVWLMSFKFEHESIAGLSRYVPLSKPEYADIQLVGRLMYKNVNSKEFGCASSRSWKPFENIGRSGFFAFSSPWLALAPGIEKNPMLFMKIASRFMKASECGRWASYSQTVRCVKGYPGKEFEKLVEGWKVGDEE